MAAYLAFAQSHGNMACYYRRLISVYEDDRAQGLKPLYEMEFDEERSRTECVIAAREAWHYALILDRATIEAAMFARQAETC